MLNHPDVQSGSVDFRSIKLSFSGAIGAHGRDRRRFEDLTGGRIIEGYSLTEGMMACMVNPVRGHGEDRVDRHAAARRRRDHRGRRNRQGAGGRPGRRTAPARASADARLLAQRERDRATCFAAPRGRHVAAHRRIGYIDEDGYVFLVDRKKDLIKPSGYQVWPREIEEVLAGHPADRRGRRGGRARCGQGRSGEGLGGGRDGAIADGRDARLCKAKLAPYKVPLAIEFRTELPKSLVGKILRRALAGTSARLTLSARPRRARHGKHPVAGVATSHRRSSAGAGRDHDVLPFVDDRRAQPRRQAPGVAAARSSDPRATARRPAGSRR